MIRRFKGKPAAKGAAKTSEKANHAAEGAGLSLSRRVFLKGAAAASAAAASGALTSKASHAAEGDHGVASGDPQPTAVTLWTRVPDALQAGTAQAVTWEVSLREDFAPGSIAAQGVFTTGPQRDFTVKVRAEGLTPFTRYHYRFRTASGYESDVGRTLTAPGEDQDVGEIRFAFVSCSSYGPRFNVYDAMASEDLHFCAHLGDNVYEHSLGYRAKSLTDWRNVYKLYLTRPELREVRRLFPWIHTWDDHEVYNNFNGAAPEEEVTGADRECQGNAYQAFWEYFPMDPAIAPGTTAEGLPHLPIHRRITYGKLLDVFALDGRQYKSGVVCGRDFALYGCEELGDPERSLLGAAQTEWLCDGLTEDRATWKVVLNQTMMMALKLTNNMRPFFEPLIGDQLRVDSDGLLLNADQWDGYPTNRDTILGRVADQGIDNLIVCTGDIHNCYAGQLKPDFTHRRGDTACGVEFVTGSVTSDGIGEILGGRDLSDLILKALRPANPHLKWLDAFYHTYTVLTFTPSRAYATYMAVSQVDDADYEVFVLKELQVAAGNPQLVFEP